MGVPALRTHEGAPAYRRSAREELYLLVASQLFSGDSLYEGQAATLARFRTLVRAIAAEPDGGPYLAALATYVRHQLMLRKAATMLVCETFALALPEAEQAAQAVWIRGDEHLDALTYMHARGKFPKRFLRAVAQRLNALTERQALRYAGTGQAKAFSQRDALRITHAIPVDERQAALFRSLTQGWKALTEEEKARLPLMRAVREGTRVASWEQVISRDGSTPDTWAALAPTMGYMALLRNLRTLVTLNVDERVLRPVAERLADPEEVASSQQLPFRFYSAYNAVQRPRAVAGRAKVPRWQAVSYWQRRRIALPARGYTAMETALIELGVQVPAPKPTERSVRTQHVKSVQVGWRWTRNVYLPASSWCTRPVQDVPPYLLSALETAMEHAAQRLGQLPGQTAAFVDLSGSMYAAVSDKSTMSRMEAACTLGGLIGRQAKCKVYGFGTWFKHVDLSDVTSALQAAQRIQRTESEVGGGTYLVPAFEAAFMEHFDRVIVLTDEQVADAAWSRLNQYLDEDGQRRAYVINLAGYQASFVGRHPRLVSVGGFSDRVLDWMAALEQPDPVTVILGHLPLKKSA
ncbi:TROVE domain-containing protein [Deinococcus arcticus]|uniref:TROVE domain-containing protein n=1 Tax=Deinococcus arcticus TaxID=2136176 RepID=A0A2T3W3L3_9DEIO|nr:TROVE domain-containing protein [Deinococcus arcticus]PTA66467.1 hypothetical protein C8263_17680 [Deinococcus arcticus]